jgi:ankyrin repeat protein
MWCRENYLDRVQEYMIGKGGDFEHRFSDGNNCLHEAFTGGHLKFVKYLIEERGADVEARNKHGQTLLEQPKVLKYLIERGADVNAQFQDDTSITALGEAVMHGRLEIAEILLENGVDVVREAVAHLWPLHAASFAAQPKLVELLLRFGADPEVVLHNGWTPLNIAGTYAHKMGGIKKKGAKEEVLKLLNHAIAVKRFSEKKGLITGRRSADGHGAESLLQSSKSGTT